MLAAGTFTAARGAHSGSRHAQIDAFEQQCQLSHVDHSADRRPANARTATNASSSSCNTRCANIFLRLTLENVMTVHCEGDCWLLDQRGEKQDFEAELSRWGFKHEDFSLDVRREMTPGKKAHWNQHYAITV